MASLVVASVYATAAALAGAPTAAAEPTSSSQSALISADGVVFGESLSQPLFSTDQGVVPGGSLVSDLWVKNPTDRPVSMVINLTNVHVSAADFGSALSLQSSESSQGFTASSLDASATCVGLLPTFGLEAHESSRVGLLLQMDRAAGNSTQGATASFDVHVAMWDAAGPPPAHLCGDGGTTIPGVDENKPVVGLPSTGGIGESDLTDPTDRGGVHVISVTLAALVVGIVLAVLRELRRRRRSWGR